MKKIALIILFALLFSALAFTASAAQAEPSGSYLRFSVDVNKPEGEYLAFNFFIIATDLGYIIQDGDVLEYDVWISLEETGWGHIDGDIDGATLRDNPNFQDQEGTGFHTGNDISFSAYNRWFRRQIEIGFTEETAAHPDRATAGQTLNSIQLSMHPSVPDNNYSGYALYDNIVITNNGEVQFVIFRDEGDLDPDNFGLSHQQGSTSTVEILIFSEEEEQAFRDAEEARVRAEEERAAARAAEAEAREEAARLAAEQAAEEEAERLAAENIIEEDETEIAIEPDEAGLPIGVIIGVAVGIIALGIIIIAVARGKKA